MKHVKKAAVFLAASLALPIGGAWLLSGPAQAAPSQKLVCHGAGTPVGNGDSNAHFNKDGTFKHAVDYWAIDGKCPFDAPPASETTTTTEPSSSTTEPSSSTTEPSSSTTEPEPSPTSTPPETTTETTPPTTTTDDSTPPTTTTDDSTPPETTTETTPPSTTTETTPPVTTTKTTPPVTVTTPPTTPTKPAVHKPKPHKPSHKPVKHRQVLSHTGESALPWQKTLGMGLLAWAFLGALIIAMVVRSNRLNQHVAPR